MREIGKSVACLCLLAFAVGLFPVQADGQEFKYGVIERIRNTYFNNIIDYNSANNDKQDFFRIRTSVWGQYTASPNVMLYAKLTNEWRYYASHPNPAVEGFDDLGEVFVDNLYAKFSGGEDTKFTLTLGRQNIIYGEGFVMLDGNPLDGSRSIYHNAVRLSVQTGPTTIDVFGLSNPHKDELVLINDKKQGLANLWEQGYGAYVTNTSNPDLKIEGYFIHKREDAGDAIPTLKLNTIGARLSRKMKDNFSFASEFAGQFGSQGVDQKGFGGYAYLKYLLSQESNMTLTGGAYYLSGDDPGTADIEGWNPLFARWPKWSELYIYSHIPELGVVNGQPLIAYPTNIFSPYLWFDVDLSRQLNLEAPKKLTVSARYHYLRALQGRPGLGKTRGNEFQTWFKFVLHKHVSGHFLFDYFMPGDFYATDDSGVFIRGDVTISF